MTTLKLEKLPDRKPVKYSIAVSPELSRALTDYAEIYRRLHGQKESVEDLIPFMLARFIKTDAGFKRARKDLLTASEIGKAEPSRPRAGTPLSGTTDPRAKGDPK